MHWVRAHGDCQPIPAGLPTLRSSSFVPDRLALVRFFVSMIWFVSSSQRSQTHERNHLLIVPTRYASRFTRDD